MGSLHPAIVHIPIGVLVAYSIIEIGLLFFPKYRQRLSLALFLMLVIGFGGGLLALQSGEALEDSWNGGALIDLHEKFASISLWLYGIALAATGYMHLSAVALWRTLCTRYTAVSRMSKGLLTLSTFVSRPPVSTLLALLGFVALTITGSLGGALAHGPEADPIVSFIYQLFIGS